jgi:DNA-binding NtrC family response regulator
METHLPSIAAHPMILLAEKKADVTQALSCVLRQAGYPVVTAMDGVEALEALDLYRPDIFVLDVDLPLLSGFRILELLKQSRWAPSVIVTSTCSCQEARQATRCGVDAFMEMPLQNDKLLEMVHFVVNKGKRRGRHSDRMIPETTAALS